MLQDLRSIGTTAIYRPHAQHTNDVHTTLIAQDG